MRTPGRIRSPRWRDIAFICRDEPKTVSAIAKEMNTERGSIQSLIRSMKSEKLLKVAASDARGVALLLTDKGHAELDKVASTGGADTLLRGGERLVFVTDEPRGVPLAHELGKLSADPDFRWAARLDGQVRWIVSFGTGDAVAADRAVDSLRASGATAIAGRSDAFFDAEELALFAASVASPPRATRKLTRGQPS